MKRVGLIAFGLIVLTAAAAVADKPQRPQGGQKGQRQRAERPQRRGFGGFGGGLIFLAGQKSVQEDLKMSEEQVKKLAELQEKRRGSFKDLQNLGREERRKKIADLAKENEKGLADVLKPEQVKRLKQISLQQQGTRAVASPEVADALKLTDEQKAKIKTIQEDAQKEVREAFQGGNREEGRKKLETIRKSTEEKVTGVLTSEQKAKLKELTGEPFKGELRRPEFRPGGRAIRAKRPGA